VTTYYVAHSGDDVNNGLYATPGSGVNGPWRTLGYAQAAAGAGDTIVLINDAPYVLGRGRTIVGDWNGSGLFTRTSGDYFLSSDAVNRLSLFNGSVFYTIVEVHNENTVRCSKHGNAATNITMYVDDQPAWTTSQGLRITNQLQSGEKYLTITSQDSHHPAILVMGSNMLSNTCLVIQYAQGSPTLFDSIIFSDGEYLVSGTASQDYRLAVCGATNAMFIVNRCKFYGGQQGAICHDSNYGCKLAVLNSEFAGQNFYALSSGSSSNTSYVNVFHAYNNYIHDLYALDKNAYPVGINTNGSYYVYVANNMVRQITATNAAGWANGMTGNSSNDSIFQNNTIDGITSLSSPGAYGMSISNGPKWVRHNSFSNISAPSNGGYGFRLANTTTPLRDFRNNNIANCNGGHYVNWTDDSQTFHLDPTLDAVGRSQNPELVKRLIGAVGPELFTAPVYRQRYSPYYAWRP